MQSRFSLKFRAVAVLLVLSFAWAEVAGASPEIRPASAASSAAKAEFAVRFPSSTALLDDAQKIPGSDRIVYLLQDAHTNFSGQMNLAKTLDILFEKDKELKTVFVEAGFGDDSLSYLRAKAPLAARRDIALRSLRQGRLHGEEYLDLTSERDFVLWGVEDRGLYERAVEAYRRTVDQRERFRTYLDQIRGAVDTLAPRIFSEAVLSFSQKQREFEKNRLPLTEYFGVLQAEAKNLGISLLGYPSLLQLEFLKEKEAALDFKKANEEHRLALGALPEGERAEILALAETDHSPGRLLLDKERQTQAYFSMFREKLTEEKGPFFPELYKYFEYLESSKKLDPQDILREQKELERDILGRMARTEDQRMLLACREALDDLDRLFLFRFTPEEFADYAARSERFTIRHLTGFLNRKIADLRDFYDRVTYLEDGFDALRAQAEGFYRLTRERDEAFVRNMEERMRQTGAKHAALITGGYHTPNLKHLLKQRNISYVSITPQVFHQTDQKRYEGLLLGQKIAAPSAAAGSMKPMARLLASADSAYLPVLEHELAAAGARLAAHDWARLQNAVPRLGDVTLVRSLLDFLETGKFDKKRHRRAVAYLASVLNERQMSPGELLEMLRGQAELITALKGREKELRLALKKPASVSLTGKTQEVLRQLSDRLFKRINEQAEAIDRLKRSKPYRNRRTGAGAIHRQIERHETIQETLQEEAGHVARLLDRETGSNSGARAKGGPASGGRLAEETREKFMYGLMAVSGLTERALRPNGRWAFFVQNIRPLLDPPDASGSGWVHGHIRIVTQPELERDPSAFGRWLESINGYLRFHGGDSLTLEEFREILRSIGLTEKGMPAFKAWLADLQQNQESFVRRLVKQGVQRPLAVKATRVAETLLRRDRSYSVFDIHRALDVKAPEIDERLRFIHSTFAENEIPVDSLELLADADSRTVLSSVLALLETIQQGGSLPKDKGPFGARLGLRADPENLSYGPIVEIEPTAEETYRQLEKMGLDRAEIDRLQKELRARKTYRSQGRSDEHDFVGGVLYFPQANQGPVWAVRGREDLHLVDLDQRRLLGVNTGHDPFFTALLASIGSNSNSVYVTPFPGTRIILRGPFIVVHDHVPALYFLDKGVIREVQAEDMRRSMVKGTGYDPGAAIPHVDFDEKNPYLLRFYGSSKDRSRPWNEAWGDVIEEFDLERIARTYWMPEELYAYLQRAFYQAPSGEVEPGQYQFVGQDGREILVTLKEDKITFQGQRIFDGGELLFPAFESNRPLFDKFSLLISLKIREQQLTDALIAERFKSAPPENGARMAESGLKVDMARTEFHIRPGITAQILVKRPVEARQTPVPVEVEVYWSALRVPAVRTTVRWNGLDSADAIAKAIRNRLERRRTHLVNLYTNQGSGDFLAEAARFINTFSVGPSSGARMAGLYDRFPALGRLAEWVVERIWDVLVWIRDSDRPPQDVLRTVQEFYVEDYVDYAVKIISGNTSYRAGVRQTAVRTLLDRDFKTRGGVSRDELVTAVTAGVQELMRQVDKRVDIPVEIHRRTAEELLSRWPALKIEIEQTLGRARLPEGLSDGARLSGYDHWLKTREGRQQLRELYLLRRADRDSILEGAAEFWQSLSWKNLIARLDMRYFFTALREIESGDQEGPIGTLEEEWHRHRIARVEGVLRRMRGDGWPGTVRRAFNHLLKKDGLPPAAETSRPVLWALNDRRGRTLVTPVLAGEIADYLESEMNALSHGIKQHPPLLPVDVYFTVVLDSGDQAKLLATLPAWQRTPASGRGYDRTEFIRQVRSGLEDIDVTETVSPLWRVMLKVPTPRTAGSKSFTFIFTPVSGARLSAGAGQRVRRLAASVERSFLDERSDGLPEAAPSEWLEGLDDRLSSVYDLEVGGTLRSEEIRQTPARIRTLKTLVRHYFGSDTPLADFSYRVLLKLRPGLSPALRKIVDEEANRIFDAVPDRMVALLNMNSGDQRWQFSRAVVDQVDEEHLSLKLGFDPNEIVMTLSGRADEAHGSIRIYEPMNTVAYMAAHDLGNPEEYEEHLYTKAVLIARHLVKAGIHPKKRFDPVYLTRLGERLKSERLLQPFLGIEQLAQAAIGDEKKPRRWIDITTDYVTFEQMRLARSLLLPQIRAFMQGEDATPLREAPELRKHIYGDDPDAPRLFLKMESETPIGSYKLWGALGKVLFVYWRLIGERVRLFTRRAEKQYPLGDLSRIIENDKPLHPYVLRRTTLITASAGNHAQGVALGAAKVGAKSLIFVPTTAALVKRERIVQLGGALRYVEPPFDNAKREAIYHEIAEEGTIFISPDEPSVITGHAAAVGVGLLEQSYQNGFRPDAVLVPTGTGALAAGIGFAVQNEERLRNSGDLGSPEHGFPAVDGPIRVIGVDSEGADATYVSLSTRSFQTIPAVDTDADGKAIARPGLVPYVMMQYGHVLDQALVTSKDSLSYAIVLMNDRLGIPAEGAGALALTPLLEDPAAYRGMKNIVIVLSGRNIDPAKLEEVREKFKRSRYADRLSGARLAQPSWNWGAWVPGGSRGRLTDLVEDGVRVSGHAAESARSVSVEYAGNGVKSDDLPAIFADREKRIGFVSYRDRVGQKFLYPAPAPDLTRAQKYDFMLRQLRLRPAFKEPLREIRRDWATQDRKKRNDAFRRLWAVYHSEMSTEYIWSHILRQERQLYAVTLTLQDRMTLHFDLLLHKDGRAALRLKGGTWKLLRPEPLVPGEDPAAVLIRQAQHTSETEEVKYILRYEGFIRRLDEIRAGLEAENTLFAPDTDGVLSTLDEVYAGFPLERSPKKKIKYQVKQQIRTALDAAKDAVLRSPTPEAVEKIRAVRALIELEIDRLQKIVQAAQDRKAALRRERPSGARLAEKNEPGRIEFPDEIGRFVARYIPAVNFRAIRWQWGHRWRLSRSIARLKGSDADKRRLKEEIKLLVEALEFEGYRHYENGNASHEYLNSARDLELSKRKRILTLVRWSGDLKEAVENFKTAREIAGEVAKRVKGKALSDGSIRINYPQGHLKHTASEIGNVRITAGNLFELVREFSEGKKDKKRVFITVVLEPSRSPEKLKRVQGQASGALFELRIIAVRSETTPPAPVKPAVPLIRVQPESMPPASGENVPAAQEEGLVEEPELQESLRFLTVSLYERRVRARQEPSKPFALDLDFRNRYVPEYSVRAADAESGVSLSLVSSHSGKTVFQVPDYEAEKRRTQEALGVLKRNAMEQKALSHLFERTNERLEQLLPQDASTAGSNVYPEFNLHEEYDQYSSQAGRPLTQAEFKAVLDFAFNKIRASFGNIYFSGLEQFSEGQDAPRRAAVAAVEELRAGRPAERGHVVTELPAGAVAVLAKPYSGTLVRDRLVLYVSGASGGFIPNYPAYYRLALAVGRFYERHRAADGTLPQEGTAAYGEMLRDLRKDGLFKALVQLSRARHRGNRVKTETLHRILTGSMEVTTEEERLLVEEFIIQPVMKAVEDQIRAVQLLAQAAQAA